MGIKNGQQSSHIKEVNLMPEVHEGGCLCRAIRYRVTDNPQKVSVCHCTFCQRRTGSSFGFHAFFEKQNVEFTGEELTTYEHRSDESNNWLRLHFCKRCGTTVMMTIEKYPGLLLIMGGTLDDPNWIKINMHVWTRSAQHWEVLPQNVDCFEKSSQGSLARR